MKITNRMKVTAVLLALLISGHINTTQASAAETESVAEIGVSLGGMSRIMNDYYTERLSETGISVKNVTIPVYVNGEKLEAVNSLSEFTDIGLANVFDYVNIRSEASADSQALGKLYTAGVATVLETVTGDDGEEWVKVTSGSVTGYIKATYLSFGEEAEEVAEANYTKYAKATCTTLNVRSEADNTSSILAQVPYGEELKIVEVGEEWIQVVYDEEHNGYVSKDYADIIYDFDYAVSKEEEEAIKRAEKEALRAQQAAQNSASSNSSSTSGYNSSGFASTGAASSGKDTYNINNMIWPLPSDRTVYTYFGYRIPPTAGASSYHKGLDIGGREGTNVVAVLSGTVVTATYSSSGGNYVVIDHGNGVQTRYLHNSKLLVSVGQKVTQGDVIALCGSTGISTSAHLHFSLVINGTYVDPYPYIKGK